MCGCTIVPLYISQDKLSFPNDSDYTNLSHSV